MPDTTNSASKTVQNTSPDENHEPAGSAGVPVERPDKETQLAAADEEAALRAAQEAAIAGAKVFAQSDGDHKANLATMISQLSKVRSKMAQRRENYTKGRRHGAPKWGQWLEGDFRIQTGVTLSAKTIKKFIDEFDGIAPAPRPKTPRVKTIAPAMQKKMGLALLAVQEMLGNVNEQGTVILTPEDIAVLRRMLPSAAVLDRAVSNLPDEEAAGASDGSPAAGNAAQPIRSTPADRQPEQSTLKPGDGGGLAATVLEKCRPELDAVLGPATLEAQAANIQAPPEKIPDEFYKPNSGRITIQVRAIPAKPKIRNGLRTAPSLTEESTASM